MSRSHLIAYLLIAATLGFLAGLFFERSRGPSPAPKGGTAEAGAPAPSPNGGEVAPPREKTASEKAMETADAAIASRKWPEAVAAIRDLIARGPAGWDDALAILLRLLSVEDPAEYALREPALMPLSGEIAFHKSSVPLARAAGTFAAELYLELAFAWLGEAHEGAYLLEALEGATQEELPRILRALEGNVTASMVPAFVAKLKSARGPGVQMQYLKVLMTAGPAAESALRELSESPDRVLSEAAAVCLQTVAPPVPGFLVMSVPGRDDRLGGNGKRMTPGALGGLRWGDIIVKAGNIEIDGGDAWRKAEKFFGGRAAVELKVVRKGEVIQVTHPAGVGAPKGTYVTAVKRE